MNAVFADTSGLFALLSTTDENHARAKRAFANLRTRQALLVSTSYVLVETYALLGRRLGLEAVRSFRADFAPVIDVVWIDEALHNAGLDLLLDRRKRQLSLVDAVSFIVMRRGSVAEAFGFDPHFDQEGFSLVT
ncbi:MAG: PIN domain-containing protein [Acidobacteria bacterium]|nr:PIN domain-containing protein [Acidobacteriota bacterium]MBV9144435.1 PIN domain-containing protein [Acidobacteriota bacterium]MBV9437161.1 PIN domain-containing protein [Acidobacteriota bacterium]